MPTRHLSMAQSVATGDFGTLPKLLTTGFCSDTHMLLFLPVCAVSESSSLTPQAGLCKVPASPIINGLEEMQLIRVAGYQSGILLALSPLHCFHKLSDPMPGSQGLNPN
ncbi:unnamed protein product [Leuciscus chuanchicus]